MGIIKNNKVLATIVILFILLMAYVIINTIFSNINKSASEENLKTAITATNDLKNVIEANREEEEKRLLNEIEEEKSKQIVTENNDKELVIEEQTETNNAKLEETINQLKRITEGQERTKIETNKQINKTIIDSIWENYELLEKEK